MKKDNFYLLKCSENGKDWYLQDLFNEIYRFSLSAIPDFAWRTTNFLSLQKKMIEVKYSCPRIRNHYFETVIYEMDVEQTSWASQEFKKYENKATKSRNLTDSEKTEVGEYELELRKKYADKQEKMGNS